jgi:hypothetical protein
LYVQKKRKPEDLWDEPTNHACRGRSRRTPITSLHSQPAGELNWCMEWCHCRQCESHATPAGRQTVKGMHNPHAFELCTPALVRTDTTATIRLGCTSSQHGYSSTSQEQLTNPSALDHHFTSFNLGTCRTYTFQFFIDLCLLPPITAPAQFAKEYHLNIGKVTPNLWFQFH